MVIRVREKTIIQRVSKISVYLARLFVKATHVNEIQQEMEPLP